MSKVNHQKLATDWKLPPNRASIKIAGPLQTGAAVQQGLFQLGLTAADLKPISWLKKVNLSPVMNQQNCGDCWCMSSVSALADRFIIQQGLNSLELSPALPAQCGSDPVDQGCGGGQPFNAGKFFENVGVAPASNSCPAWDKFCSQSACALPSCKQMTDECAPQNIKLFKAVKGSTRNLPATNADGTVDASMTIINMKKELLNGPFVACFFVPVDFMVSAVYTWDLTKNIFINGAYNDILDKVIPDTLKSHLGNPKGKQWQDIMMEGNSPSAHAVEVCGHDVEDIPGYGKVPYWIVRNSWGSDWMKVAGTDLEIGGYFKIAMNDGSGRNALLGFDVPVTSLVIASTGQSTSMNGLFGGGVSFLPDIKNSPISGGKGDQRGAADKESSSTSKKTVKTIIIISAVILGAVVIALLYRKYKPSKKSRK